MDCMTRCSVVNRYTLAEAKSVLNSYIQLHELIPENDSSCVVGVDAFWLVDAG